MNGEKVLTLELLRVTTDLGFLIVVGLVLTKHMLYLLSYVGLLHFILEGVGFEPTQPLRAADLQSAPINHSGTPPWYNLIIGYLKNPAREGIRTH